MSPSRSSFVSLAGFVAVTLALGSLGSCADDSVVVTTTPGIPFELGQYGSLVDPLEYEGTPETLPPFALKPSGKPDPLPRDTVLTNLPVAAQQGTAANPGSPGTPAKRSRSVTVSARTPPRAARTVASSGTRPTRVIPSAPPSYTRSP